MFKIIGLCAVIAFELVFISSIPKPSIEGSSDEWLFTPFSMEMQPQSAINVSGSNPQEAIGYSIKQQPLQKANYDFQWQGASQL